MVSKFDRIIEHIINEDNAAARKLFHDVVVEKSRKIYEDMEEAKHEDVFDEVEHEETAGIGGDEADDFEDDVVDHDVDQPSVGNEDELFADDDEEMADDDSFDADDEFGDEENEFGDEEASTEDEGEVEDRIVDLEDSLAELQAEFAKLVTDEEGDEEVADEDEEVADEDEEVADEDEEVADEDEDEDEDEEKLDENVQLDPAPKPVTSETDGTNKKSAVNFNSGSQIIKGVTSKNLTQGTKGGEEKGRPAPTTKELKAGGDSAFRNRPSIKKGELKPVSKKPVTRQEVSGTNTKPVIESKKKPTRK